MNITTDKNELIKTLVYFGMTEKEAERFIEKAVILEDDLLQFKKDKMKEVVDTLLEEILNNVKNHKPIKVTDATGTHEVKLK